MKNKQTEVVKLESIAIRPKEAAALLSVSPRKFAAMKSAGQLPPSHKLGGCTVFLLDDLKAWAAYGFPTLDRFITLQKAEVKK